MSNFSLKTRRKGDWVYGELTLAVAPRPGARPVRKTFRAKVNLHTLVAAMKRAGERYGVHVGFSLKGIWRKAKKTARKVVKSKVWAIAEKASEMGSMLPPPYGPALAAANGAMKVTRGLVAAQKKLKAGDKAGAQQLVNASKAVAQKFPNIDMQGAVRASRMLLALVPG